MESKNAVEKQLAEKYGLKKECFWFHQQSKKYIICYLITNNF